MANPKILKVKTLDKKRERKALTDQNSSYNIYKQLKSI